ncbi:zinc-binding dehydrogenase [Nitrospinae bacterium AH-259-F20]|nr:zinc-binding dehydrogenase [Nitrospinae bacterium AH-259-F20]
MRAVRFHEFGGPEVLKVEEVDDPQAGPGQILVSVKACGFNHLDLLLRAGAVPDIPMPHICGSEVAGVVEAVGPGVEAPAVGDRVAIQPFYFCGTCRWCQWGEESLCEAADITGMMNQGGYAERMVAPASSAVAIPAEVSFEAAAAVTLSTLTAWHMLVNRAKLKHGETLLVVAAASGVGSAAVQVGRLAGARVLAAASTDEKLARAKALGADVTINYTTENLAEAVREATGGRGAEVVCEMVGQALWQDAIACLARGGRLVTCGAHTGGEVTLNIFNLFLQQHRLIGSTGGTRAELATILELVAEGRFQAVIHATYPLEEARAAHEALAARAVVGKALLVP